MLLYRDGQVTLEKEIRVPGAGEIAFITLINPSDEQVQQVVGEMFGCHPLVVEDCTHLRQRPKVDIYPDHAFLPFFVLNEEWELDEIAIVIGKNYVIATKEFACPLLHDLQRDLQRSPRKMENSGHLLYEILDRCVNQYLDLVDVVEEQVTDMEDAIYQNPFVKLGAKIFNMKRNLHKLRRVFSEERNVIGTLMHSEFPYTREEMNVFLMDVYDHTSRVIDAIDTFRESMTGLLELQMSMKGDRMNEIMKTLTIVSTFFLPLSFIVGLYGMNVKVPEYGWDYGYAWVWGLCIAVVIGMYMWIKRKKWF